MHRLHIKVDLMVLILITLILILGHAVCRAEAYAAMETEAIIINAIGMAVVAVAIVVLYTVRGTGGYRLRKVAAQHPS